MVMHMSSYEPSSEELESIPGIGKKIAQDLRSLGCHSVKDLEGADPVNLYDRLCKSNGMKIDPCVLYTFKCAVYYANGGREPGLLKWWNWKNKNKF